MNPEVKINFKSIMIYGMGMMGASLAKTLRDRCHFNGRIDGTVRSEESATYIKENKLADQVFCSGHQSAFPFEPDNYELIIIALPVKAAIKMLNIFPVCNALVTDMSSTRGEINGVALARSDLRFIGSHPICGSEESGPYALKENLYQNRLCIITPPNFRDKNSKPTSSEQQQSDLIRVEKFWQAVGMKTWLLDADSHDEILAYLSHSPHLLSSLLTLWAKKNGSVAGGIDNAPTPLTGGGFKDMSRIAGSNPEMWLDIVDTNKSHIIKSLTEFASDLETLIENLNQATREELNHWLIDSRQARDLLRGSE